MTAHLTSLPSGDLSAVVAALRSKRLAPPFTPLTIQRLVSGSNVKELAAEMQRFADLGFLPDQLAATLELVLADRTGSQRTATQDNITLVTTGPEASGVTNRDTSVVVRELFANASDSVLVAGYAVYQGQRVFQALADRMRERPQLTVRMFLDIQRSRGDTTIESDLASPTLCRPPQESRMAEG